MWVFRYHEYTNYRDNLCINRGVKCQKYTLFSNCSHVNLTELSLLVVFGVQFRHVPYSFLIN
jgi:hypothetical protein